MIEEFFRRNPPLRVLYKALLKYSFRLLDRDDGVRVMDEDWDNLIVLDACRFDDFRDVNWIEGKLNKKISLGSHTEDWLRKNFREYYPDTVYISGNPYISRVKLEERYDKVPFYHIEEVWDYGWNDENQILPPRKITEAALKVRDEYPDKRMIVHYMQPHWPFNPKKVDLKEKISSMKLESANGGILWGLMKLISREHKDAQLALEKRTKKRGNVWDYLREGKLGSSVVREAYMDNLKFVLSEIDEFVPSLDGKTVVTSDHGNLFGENHIYGHPSGFRFKELVEVPWLEVSPTSNNDR